MPVAERGPPMPKTNRRWSDDELRFLHILEIELKDLSKDDYVGLFNAVFPYILKNGLSYNYAKLHENWQYRHSPGRNEMWRAIARPNSMQKNSRSDLHTQEERDKFETVRRQIRARAQELGIALGPAPTRRVDDGTGCDCNECTGKVKRRQPTLDEDGNVKPTAARGQSAKKQASKGNTASGSSSTALAQFGAALLAHRNKRSSNSAGLMDANDPYLSSVNTSNTTATAPRRTGRTRNTRPNYGMGGEDWESDEANEAEDDAENEEDQDDEFNDFTSPGQQNQDRARLDGSPAPTHTNRLHAPVDDITGEEENEVPQDGMDGHDAIDSSGDPSLLATPADMHQTAPGEDTAAQEQTHAIKLKECYVALDDEDAIPMFHYRDLVMSKSKWLLMLHPNAEPIPQQDPVRKHGGPIMLVNMYQSGLAYPYMICDKARCQECNKFADPTIQSCTWGFGFVHASQCLPDEESRVLIFAPKDDGYYTYVPCQEGQAFKVREVVLGHEGGPLRHELAVCDEATCVHCLSEADQIDRQLDDLTLRPFEMDG